MTASLYLPTTRLVADAWLRLAVPGVGVDEELPEADDQLRAAGFIRTATVGGGPNRYVPMRQPVVAAECWVPPNTDRKRSWRIAEQLAERVVQATFDPAFMGVLIDLSTVGRYRSARVHDVIALGDPQRDDNDPSDWARFDVDLAFTWTGA